MKNSKILMAVAGTAMVISLVSCSKEQDSSKSLVRFRVLSNETKANVVTTSSINQKDNCFIVDLYDAKTKETVGSLGHVVTCGDPETENVNPVTGLEWKLDELIYWENRTIDAWARYPMTLKGGSIGRVQSNAGSSEVTYVKDTYGNVIAIDDDLTSQSFNFLTYYDGDAEEGRCDADLQDDLLFAYKKGTTAFTNGGRIELNFAHALAAVYFKVSSDTDSEMGSDVVVKSLEINNVKRAGSCVYDPSKSDAARFAWDTSDGDISRDKGDYVQTYNTPVGAGGFFLGGDGKSFENANCFFVIPQTMGEDAALTVNWSKGGEDRMSRTAQIYQDKNGNVVEWKAGYKYLYTFKIKKLGAEIDVDVQVLPWDYNEQVIDFEGSVSGAQPLVFHDATVTDIDGDNTRVTYNSQPVRGTFLLDKPVGGQWLVSLSNNSDFEVYTKVGDNKVSAGGVASGTIDGSINVSTFYIAPKSGLDRSVDHTTKVFITVIRPDGASVSADEQLSTAKYTILLPKTSI